MCVQGCVCVCMCVTQRKWSIAIRSGTFPLYSISVLPLPLMQLTCPHSHSLIQIVTLAPKPKQPQNIGCLGCKHPHFEIYPIGEAFCSQSHLRLDCQHLCVSWMIDCFILGSSLAPCLVLLSILFLGPACGHAQILPPEFCLTLVVYIPSSYPVVKYEVAPFNYGSF